MKLLPLLWFAVVAAIAPALAIAAPFAYVTNFTSGSVSVIDTATNTVTATIPVGNGPNGIAVNSTGTRVYVAVQTDQVVAVIDTSTNTVITTIPSGQVTSGIVLKEATARGYATNSSNSDNVMVFDTNTNAAVTTIAVGDNPHIHAINPAGTRVYVPNQNSDSLSVIDTTTDTVIATIPVGDFPNYVAVNPAGTRVYVTNSSSRNVSVIDTATNTVVATFALTLPPPPPASQTQSVFDIEVSLDGSRLYVAHRLTLSNIVDVLDAATGAIVTTIATGFGPRGMAMSPSGARLYVVNQGANSVSVVDTATNAVVATIPVGSQPLNIALVPATPPRVSIDQAAAQADPTPAGPINFTVVFNESVTGFDAADISFAGSTAGGALTALVTGGPATYNVAVSGMTSNGTVVASVAAGAAVDSFGVPSLASTSTDNTVTLNDPPPSVTINQAAGQVDPSPAGPINFTVVFSENVTGFDAADLSFTGSTAAGALTAVVTGGPATYNVAVSGMTSSGMVVVSVVASAATGSLAGASLASTSTDNSVTFGASPSVTINQAVGQVDPTNTSPVLFTVTFSEPVTGFTAADVSLSTGTLGGASGITVTGSGASYTVSVAGMAGQGTLVVSIPAGAATNGSFASLASTSTDNSVTYDNLVPAAVINHVGQVDPATTSPILFTVVFTEAVTGFTSSDVSFAGSTAAGTLVASVTGSGASYTVSVSGMTGNGVVRVSFAAGAAADQAGNPSLGPTAFDNAVAYIGAGAIVTSFTGPSGTGTGNITAQFTGGGPTCSFSNPQFIGSPPGASPIPPTVPPGSIGFPHGLFSFTTINCTPGSTLAFTVTYPTALPAGTQYWKYGPEPGNATPHWYVLPATIAGNVATFSITDGAQGDDDLAANGTIVDQGGPGFPVGTGGAHQTPTLAEWAMALMALLMMIGAAAGLRRRG